MAKKLGERIEDWWDGLSARAAITLHAGSFLLVGAWGGSYISTAALEQYRINKIKNNYGINEAIAHCKKVNEDFSNKNAFVQLFSGKDNAAKDYLDRVKNS